MKCHFLPSFGVRLVSYGRPQNPQILFVSSDRRRQFAGSDWRRQFVGSDWRRPPQKFVSSDWRRPPPPTAKVRELGLASPVRGLGLAPAPALPCPNLCCVLRHT